MENALIAENIRRICKEKNLSMSNLLAECGIRKSLIYDLEKRDYTPSISIMETLADHLNVSLDELTGRTTHITYGNVTGNNSGNAGNTNCSFGAAPDCSEEAKEIDHMLKSLSFKDRAQLMNIIVEFVESHKP